MNKYITHKRFDGEAICGKIVIPVGTELTEFGGVLFLGKNAICCVTSENAHKHFANNNDGCGLLRGQLTQSIQKTLEKPERATEEETKTNNERWEKIWTDRICSKYKRPEYDDYWLWNHDFYEAAIIDLNYIAGIIGVKKSGQCTS